MEKKSTIEEIEKIIKQIEKEINFENIVKLFGEASNLVKQTIDTAASSKGKIVEIIRDLDQFIEKEFK
jgi:exonuclease VII small subunit